jgi:hypothetical protein
MRTALIVFAFVGSVALLSCQKEVTEQEPNTPAGTEKLLTKYVYSEPGDSYIETFIYDQQNRCVRMNQEYIDSAAGVPYRLFTEFHYIGNDNLPYKVTDTSEGRDMNSYLFYDAQNRRTIDSVIFLRGNPGWVTRYNYSGNRVVATTIYANTPATGPIIDTLESDGANWTRYSYKNQGISQLNFQTKVTYDNHPSAFSTVNISKALILGFTLFSDFTQSSKNNPQTIQYFSNYTPILNYGYGYTYVYDADGYPVSSTLVGLTDPTRVDREIFIYNK